LCGWRVPCNSPEWRSTFRKDGKSDDPATARVSGSSGDANQKPENIIAMATKFYLPDGTITDLIGITL
jgi:hypothetical protein